MKRLLKVKEFNRIQKDKYSKAVKEWDYKKGGFPSLAMYIFTKDNAMPRKKGFVVSNGDSHTFYLTKDNLFNCEGMRSK